MASISTPLTPAQDAWSIAALVASDGCANLPVLRRLTETGVPGRDLADAVHALCAVHGRLTELFEEAGHRRVVDLDNRWLDDAPTAFGIERAYLAHLTAAVGPLPSTPGQAESDAAFAAQRHAFDMLARSDRAGCATGAAIALIIDWHAFRRVLDAAAARAGLAPVPSRLPEESAMIAIADTPLSAPVRRALAFGAQQTFAQHRGLCNLIEARAVARAQH